MAETFNVWPSNVPTSYSGEEFRWPENQSLPAIYGIDLTNPFFLSFLIGAAFVAFFSVTRFNQRSHDPLDPVTAESRILQELTPMDLRDPRLIAQSYVLYVAVLLGIYTAFTFYGSLILNWVNNVLPVAGYTTDLGQYDFTSPQWPLFVALGMIGVLPVLKPVEAMEIRLRRWTHRAVGIPLTIYRHAEAMRLQYRILAGGKPGGGPIYDRASVPDWLRAAVGDDRAIDEAFEAREQLGKLADWIKDGRGEWPSGQSDRPMERLFDAQYEKARDAMRGFAELIDPKNRTAPPLPDGSADPAAVADNQARHIARLRASWDRIAQETIDARDSVLALLGVGAEKQSDYARIANPRLRELIAKAVHVDDFQRGPQVGIFLLLTPIFVVYAAAIYFNFHAPFTGGNNTKVSVVVISAVYEVLLICAVFLFPLMAAMNYRFWRKVAYRDVWEQLRMLDFEQKSMLQVLSAAALAFLVAVVGLTLLAVAQAGIVARGTSEFRRVLVEAGIPLLQASLSLAGISVIVCLGVLFAVEEHENLRAAAKAAGRKKQPPPDPRPRMLRLALLCAASVFVYQLVLTFFWYGQVMKPVAFTTGGLFFFELFKPWTWDQDLSWVWRYYALTSLVIYSLLAFLAVAVLIPGARGLPAAKTAAASPPPPPPDQTARPGLAAVLLLAGLIFGLSVGHALGAGDEAGDDRMVNDRTVVVGFRTDAPPFSYLRQFGEEKRYAGYLAQLCEAIFTGDATHRYRMVATTVTAVDRFSRLVRSADEHWSEGQPLPQAKVDLLCDPITLRYSAETADDPPAGRFDTTASPASRRYGARPSDQPDPPRGKRTDGIFSPIVYVTGVSYLERSGGTDGQIGFVIGTTAGRVAREACSRDGLRVRDNSARTDSGTIDRCTSAERLGASAVESSRCVSAAPPAPPDGPGRGPDYQFCGFKSHTDLVRWFCEDGIKTKRYYFGDKDLIVGQYEAWRDAGNVCDGVASDYPFRSYEPYALLISKVNPDLVQFVQRRIYEIFSDREQVISLFTANFKGKAMSTPLANLFNLNGVEDRLQLAPETLGPELAAR